VCLFSTYVYVRVYAVCVYFVFAYSLEMYLWCEVCLCLFSTCVFVRFYSVNVYFVFVYL